MEVNDPKYLRNHFTQFIKSDNISVFNITKILKQTNTYQKYEVEVIRMNNKKTRGKLLLKIRKDSMISELQIDDLIYTTARYLEIRKPLNPNEFDYRSYLENVGIYRQVIIDKGAYIHLERQGRSLIGIASSIRLKINRLLKRNNFSIKELAIVNAILLGQRTEISAEHFRQYRDAGAIHILAVSGLHIGILLYFLNILLKPFERVKRGKFLKTILIIIILWFYAFLAGLSASVIRAVMMFSAMAVGFLVNKKQEVMKSLIISFFVLLLYDPFYLFDIGFQLSYTAVFFIIWLQPSFRKIWNPKHRIMKYLWSLFTVTITAQIGVLPLSIYYFHQFPTLFFVSSMVIIPFLGMILGFGFLILLLTLMEITPQYLFDFYEIMIFIMNEFIAFISDQEFFIIRNISMPFLYLISFFFLIFSIGLWIRDKRRHSVFWILIATLFLQFNLLYQKQKLRKHGQLIVFHRYRSTTIAVRNLDEMIAYQEGVHLKEEYYSPLNDYLTSLPSVDLSIKNHIKNAIFFGSVKLMIIDSSGIYNGSYFEPDIVLLINSPKINVDRMINKLSPQMIIADGSNTWSMLKAWNRSTKNHNIKFHNTRDHGAFIYNYKR